MAEQSGVEILLRPKTRIPRWITNQTLNVTTRQEKKGIGRIRILRIKGGEAAFIGEGGVVVRMPGSDESWVAFSPWKVLEIRSLKGDLIKRNHHLCEECFTLSGRTMIHTPSQKIAGREDITYECSRCNHSWKLEGI